MTIPKIQGGRRGFAEALDAASLTGLPLICYSAAGFYPADAPVGALWSSPVSRPGRRALRAGEYDRVRREILRLNTPKNLFSDFSGDSENPR